MQMSIQMNFIIQSALLDDQGEKVVHCIATVLNLVEVGCY